jgi:dynactin-6
VIHPKCQIIAEGGDITIGDHCIIEEKVRIINRARRDEQGRPVVKRDMHIGSYNFFEVHSSLDSTDVGDLNEFQFRSVVQDGCRIENFC